MRKLIYSLVFISFAGAGTLSPMDDIRENTINDLPNELLAHVFSFVLGINQMMK